MVQCCRSLPAHAYEIPEDQLVPTRVGTRRGKKLFRGRDILEYMNRGRPPKP
jgi:hypothetical protein